MSSSSSPSTTCGAAKPRWTRPALPRAPLTDREPDSRRSQRTGSRDRRARAPLHGPPTGWLHTTRPQPSVMQAWWPATIWERVKTSRRSHWTLPLTDDGEVATAAFALFRSLDWRGAAGVAAFEGRVERGAATAVAPVRPQEPKALEGHFPSRGEGEGQRCPPRPKLQGHASWRANWVSKGLQSQVTEHQFADL